MVKFFKRLLGKKAEIKTGHFTDTQEFFNGVEFDAYTHGGLSL